MQPSQLPRDDQHRPKTRHLQRGALWLLLALAVAVAALALLRRQQGATSPTGPPSVPPSAKQATQAGYHHPSP